MTDFEYNVWQRETGYCFTCSFSWHGLICSVCGDDLPSPTQCWDAAVNFMLMVCKCQN